MENQAGQLEGWAGLMGKVEGLRPGRRARLGREDGWGEGLANRFSAVEPRCLINYASMPTGL